MSFVQTCMFVRLCHYDLQDSPFLSLFVARIIEISLNSIEPCELAAP